MLVVTADNFRILPDQKVLKGFEFAQLVQATELVEMAQRKADQIVASAEAALAAEEERGFQLGLARGKEEVAELMLTAVGETVNYLSILEERLVSVVTQALQRIIGELDDSDLIVRVVRQALEVARNQKQVTVRVCPEQANVVKDRVDELLAAFPAIRFIDVQSDQRLKIGDCILETEMGVVEASVDVQIEAIRKSLLKLTQQSG